MEKKQVFYKSDVQVILACDAGWTQPFKLRFYAASPSRYHLASYDGETYVGCHLTNDGRLCVSIDNTDANGKSKLGVGTLMVEPEIILDNDGFDDGACNEKVKATPVECVATNGTKYNVVLDLNGSSTLELIGTLPPYWQKGITDEEYQAVLDATEDANDAVDDANAAIALCQVAATSAGSAATQATQAASNAERAKGNVDVALSQLDTFTQQAQQVVAGAGNVNASLNGAILTVTDKTGLTRQQNVMGPKGDKGDKGEQGPAVEIVDNLTTSDGTKALSAKQGKALKDSADFLEQSVNGALEGIQQYIGDIETLGTGEGSIVECIENDRGYISQLVAGKVDKTDIADNLTTNDSTKVLSAKQGRNLALDQSTIRQDIQRIYDDEIGDTDISEIGDTITEAIYNESEKLSELEGEITDFKALELNETNATQYELNAMQFASSGKNIFECDGKIYITSDNVAPNWFKTNYPNVSKVYSIGTDKSNPYSLFALCTMLEYVNLRYGNLGTYYASWPYNCFKGCTSLKYVDLLGLTCKCLDLSFDNCCNLETIYLPDVLKGTNNNRSTFFNCTKLTNIKGSGVIERSLNLSPCPITRESYLVVANALTNYNEWSEEDKSAYETTGLKLYLSSYTKSLLSDEDKAIVTNKGWTII